MTGAAERAAGIAAGIAAAYPVAACELDFRDPYELLVATILSAQCTDARVNLVTPALFRRWPDAAALAACRAGPSSRRWSGRPASTATRPGRCSAWPAAVVARHGGAVPRTMDELTALPGVGRKTANVVLGTAFGVAAGVVVDTHVARLSQRLGLTGARSPRAIERDLMALVPARRLGRAGAPADPARAPRLRGARSRRASAARWPRLCPRKGVAKTLGPRPVGRGPKTAKSTREAGV